MGYRNNYEDRDKLFQTNIEDKPVNQRDVKKRLEGLFSEPKKTEENRCLNGHNWTEPDLGPSRCSRCKIPKPKE